MMLSIQFLPVGTESSAGRSSCCIFIFLVGLLAGRLSLCDIRGLPCDRQPMLSARICLPSCWTHQCQRGLGLLMQIMTLDLPRRDRLGWDQLQIKPCLEPDSLTAWEVWLLPAAVSLISHGRRKGWAGNANWAGGEIPLCQLGQGNAKGSFPVLQGWALLLGYCRHGSL